MKVIKYISIFGALLATAGFVACDDDEDDYFESDAQNSPIVVTDIYLENCESKTPDRKISGTFVRVGQLIRLEGSGFYGMRKVYINGYDTYFNRATVSDNSMLVTINSKTPVTDADPEDRNKIRLVKDGAEYTYDNIVIRAAQPYVTSVSNTLPAAGTTVVCEGENLQEVTEVTLPGGVVVSSGIESDNKDGEWFSFVMPDGVTEGGSIAFVGANGQGKTPEYFNRKDGLFLNFDGVGAQGAWGGKDDEGNVKPTASMIYPDDLANDPLEQNDKCFQLIPDRMVAAGGVQSGKPRAVECWTAGNDDADDDWSRFYSIFPAETPAEEVAFQFDVYCPEPWSETGVIQVNLYNNFNFSGPGTDDDNKANAVAIWCPWIDGADIVPFQTEGWQTVTIPFSDVLAEDMKPSESGCFGKFFGLTFQDIVEARNTSSFRNFGMGLANTDFTMGGVTVTSTAMDGNTKVYIDNWRLVPIKSFTISDYPEDDED